MAPVTVRHLPRHLAEAARAIATRLAEGGHRAWIVGGAVRDLALGRAVKEVDLATEALPEEIEALFPRTFAVGRAFGTVVVLLDELSVEVTTFRSDGAYTDGRRPDSVAFGATPEEDARRRDFRINAVFLDPLTDEVLDPEGGLADLAAGRLDTVGDPRARFEEDALRLLRLVRFAARLDLEVPDTVRSAARATAAGLARVSRERILDELSKILTGPRPHRALAMMGELGLVEPALPGLLGLGGLPPVEGLARRVEALEWLECDHLASGLALLLDPLAGPRPPADELLDGLRPSKALAAEVRGLWDLLDALEALAPEDECEPSHGPDRAARLRILLDPLWPRARDLASAWGDARCGDEELEGGHLGRNARELSAWAALLPQGALDLPALLTSADLTAAGVARGPRFGELFGRVRDAQLEGRVHDRADALAWLEHELGRP